MKTTFHLSIKIANPIATSFYVMGYAAGMSVFGSARHSTPNALEQLPLGRGRVLSSVADEYRWYMVLKESLLAGTDLKSSVLPAKAFIDHLKTFLSLYSDRLGVEATNADAVRRFLVDRWRKHSRVLIEEVSHFGGGEVGEVTCFVIPGIGERAEALKQFVVMGDSFHPLQDAFPVMLEELLHVVVHKDVISQCSALLGRNTTSLAEEAAIGYLLDLILRKLHWPDISRRAVVYGWRAGRRRPLVKKLQRQHFMPRLNRGTRPSKTGQTF